MKKITIVFQGDSITDAGRDKRNYHDMGPGYPKYASEAIRDAYPDVEFEFINQGISGNRTSQLFDRLYSDALSFEPDVISILIGVNDIWHRAHRIETSDAQIELNYRSVLESIKRNTDAKIVMLAPYALDGQDAEFIKGGLPSVISIIEELAKEFADVYIPLNEHFARALETQPTPLFYSEDGVHPNEEGRKFIGRLYAEAVIPLVKELI